MLSFLRKSKLAAKFILAAFAFSLVGITPATAQETYPAIARLSFVSGPVTYSRGDDPGEWDDAIENVPLTLGDRIYAPEDGRAELQLSSGNFIRLAPRSYLSNLNLSDDIKQFYLGEGTASFNIRRLQSDELIEIDTPNISVTLEEPGRYRVAVDEDGNSRVIVRSGRVTVAANGRQIAVENSEIRVYGIDSPRYEIVGLPATDAFDRWIAERDDRYDRAYTDAYRYTSDDVIGAEDLADYGRWEDIPEYGYAWTPTRVAVGWAPFSDGRWYWQDPWGWTWIGSERWGWATSHYGRWTPYRSRWYWVPARPRTRVKYIPACVEFVRVRDHVGWFPLHPRDRYIPWWDRRERIERHVTYVNRNYVTLVNQNTFVSARPVNKHIVRDAVILRDARSARFTSESLPVPNRASLRVISETGARRGYKPSNTVLSRVAVVRTAPPAPPPTFREKLPEIQKTQGRPVDPSRASALASQNDKERIQLRPAAVEKGGTFAPRNPAATSGPAPQPVTAARGKKLASQDQPVKPGTPPPARQSAEPNKPLTARPEASKPEQERARQPQPELERRRQEKQKEQERKTQLQKQQEQQRQQQLGARPAQEENRKAMERRQEQQPRSREQQRLEELERAQQREEAGKAQAQQNRQEQERREQLRQQQALERQAQQQRQQEAVRRQQQEQQRKAQTLQQQQEQARREQLRQQQVQQGQAREAQRQQDLQHRQQQQQQQRQEAARAQQLRQQQAQREAQQQKQPEQSRRPQPTPQPQQERPLQPVPRQPGQF